MSDELIVDTISTGKKIPSCMLCRLAYSGGQHGHVMHEVRLGDVGIPMLHKNKERMITVVIFESIQGVVSLRCKVSVHLGEALGSEVLIVGLVLKP